MVLGEPVAVELMNTIWADREGVHDVLVDADGLAGWLSAVNLAGDGDLVDEFRRLRDALRFLAAAATGDTRPAAASPTQGIEAAVAAVNASCAYAPSWSEMEWPRKRVTKSAHSGAIAELSTIAEQAIALFTGEARDKLRACHAPGCVLYFIRDHPRREWCSAGCGNRARVARHYKRHHASE
jgi:predicted RNA-binding Zn ribbon-like protein